MGFQEILIQSAEPREHYTCLEESTRTARIQALLDHIRALDKSMDEARRSKIENIKKALADGTYHVSAADIARKILDHMQEP
jgi:flagellar biosynthesis anti-sigma factor FlgM